jgi:RHS repeat-associated protein
MNWIAAPFGSAEDLLLTVGVKDIDYTLDAAGNRTAENIYASGSGTPSHSLSRQYNTLGELAKTLDAYSHATSYSYDANGNRTDSTDPLGIVTHSSYDALNRLAQTIQNYQGTDTATANTTTSFAYDSRDNLTQVTDPDSLNTQYTYDGLSDLGQLQSPDTGTSSYAYDAAGNRVTKTDARGVVSTYSYDALNRLTAISYPTSTLNVHYYYDEPNSTTGCASSYPIGRLTRMTDASGTTKYCYDGHGNVVSKTQIPAAGSSGTMTITYSYDSADRWMGVGYPDLSIQYVRDADGRISTIKEPPHPIIVGESDVSVSGISYLPFGPATQYTFDSGKQVLNKTYDANYRATDITGSALTLHFKRDAVGNITAEGNAAGVPTPSETYQYDPLYRLQQVSNASGAPWQSYTYDKTGDRLSKTTALQTPSDTYSYTPNTHHLIGISGYDPSSRSMDANGNTSAFQANGWMYGLGYDDTNRLTLVQQNGATTATYAINGKGERVGKTVAGTQTAFVYDESGKLLYEQTGNANRAYIWAGGTLVATMDNGTTVSYVYTDHLGTPRAVIGTTSGGISTATAGTDTFTSSSTIWTWPWQQNPFGEKPASGKNGYTLNLRYLGQYFDAETGLAYNMFRDYESATGRFPESDPIGLKGGISTYAYVTNSPYSHSDRLGLDDSICMFNPSACQGSGVPPPAPWGGVQTGVSVSYPTDGFLFANSPNPFDTSSYTKWTDDGSVTQEHNALPDYGVSFTICTKNPESPDDDSSCNKTKPKKPKPWTYPDYSVGFKRLGIQINEDGTMCINFGIGIGSPLNAGY